MCLTVFMVFVFCLLLSCSTRQFTYISKQSNYYFSNKQVRGDSYYSEVWYFYIFASSIESQSSPSNKPEPCVAHVLWIYHYRKEKRTECVNEWWYERLGAEKAWLYKLTVLFFSWCKPSFSVTWETSIALGRSCLLANTNTTASRSSSSWSYW